MEVEYGIDLECLIDRGVEVVCGICWSVEVVEVECGTGLDKQKFPPKKI